MGLVTFADGVITHRVNLLGPRPAGHVRQAVVILRAFDELTGAPVRTPVRVSTGVAGLRGQSAEDGVVGLVGVPFQAFPDLSSTSYRIDIRVEADGYTPWSRALTVPVTADFPGAFTGLDLGRIGLRRRRVVLEVRTFQLAAHGRAVPLGGVDVRVTSIWRAQGTLIQPGQQPLLLSLPLGTSQRWPSGTGLDSVSLVPIPEPARRLAQAAAPGDTRIFVDRAGGVTPGELVGLDLADADRREYLPMASVVSPGDPESPAQLALADPVRVAHREGGLVRRVSPPAAGPADTTLTETAEAGDSTAFVASTAPFGTIEILRAAGATISDEYVDSHLFRATTNAEGLARLPALSRVAAVQITATHGTLTATARVSPDYLRPVNTVELTLR